MRKRILIPLLALLLPWLLLEAALRLSGFNYLSEAGFHGAQLEPFWRLEEDHWTQTRPATWFSGRVSLRKSSEEVRVVFVGGSSMFLMGNFQAFKKTLEASLPGKRVTPINMGVPVWGSFREKLLAVQGLALQPDLLVVYSGHNEFFEDFVEGREESGWRLVRQVLLRWSRLAQGISWVADRAAAAVLERGMTGLRTGNPVAKVPWQMNLGNGGGFSEERRNLWLDGFQRNLEEMVASYEAAGVPVLLVTTAWNREIKPAHAKVSTKEAVALWRDGLQKKKEGKWKEAKALLEKSLDWDFRKSSPAVNERVRQAATRAGAHFLDFDSLLSEEVKPSGIPGWDQFFDQCHLRSPRWTDFLQIQLARKSAAILSQ